MGEKRKIETCAHVTKIPRQEILRETLGLKKVTCRDTRINEDINTCGCVVWMTFFCIVRGIINYKFQSMGVRPNFTSASLHLEKHREPMKGLFVLVADNGEGCAQLMILCLVVSMPLTFAIAGCPHTRNTTWSFLLTSRMIASVNVSHLSKTKQDKSAHKIDEEAFPSTRESLYPLPLWLYAVLARTVSTTLSSNTP